MTKPKKGKFDLGDALDIDGLPEASGPSAKERPAKVAHRPGPMAAAIRSAGSAAKAMDARDEDAEMEMLELAVEARQAREARQHLKLLSIDVIAEDHLTRDRTSMDEEGLAELKSSILANGLSSPIRVDDLGSGRFGLNQGRRRLCAYRELYEETGDEQFREIPAIVDEAQERERSYRRMVDENLVRENVSFAELAALAISYATEANCSVEDSVQSLFASVSRQKRSDITIFVGVLSAVGDAIRHPAQISRQKGRRIASLVATPEGKEVFLSTLSATDEHSAEAEALAIDRALAGGRPKAIKATTKSAVRKLRVRTSMGKQLDFAVTEKKLVISAKGMAEVSDETLKRIGELLEEVSPPRH